MKTVEVPLYLYARNPPWELNGRLQQRLQLNPEILSRYLVGVLNGDEWVEEDWQHERQRELSEILREQVTENLGAHQLRPLAEAMLDPENLGKQWKFSIKMEYVETDLGVVAESG